MQRIRHRKIHSPTFKAAIALATALLLAACSPEAPKQGVNVAAASQTETATTDSLSQEELARDIRTIVTGVKSPAQQAALAQAARIAPGQMNHDLREILVDAATFVNYLMLPALKADDARLDSLSQLLTRALQPQFSQEELTADLLSITSEDEYIEPVRWARQITAAWLAMQLPVGEMSAKLKHAVIKAMPIIGNELVTIGQELLSTALLNQYTNYSDANLAADILMIQTNEEDIYTPYAAIHVASRRKVSGSNNSDNQVNEGLGPESIAAMIKTLIWLNEKINERAYLLERLEAAGNKKGKANLETKDQDQWRNRETLHGMLTYAVNRFENLKSIEALANTGNFQIWFTHIGNRSVVPIVDVLSGERLYTRQAQARLGSLTEIVRYTPLIEEAEPLSPENRDLIVRTARHFLDEDGLQDFHGLNIRGVFSSVVDLALTLNEPDLIQVVDMLATNREELIARGIHPAEVEYFQMDIKRAIEFQQDIKEFRDPFNEPKLSQNELVDAIQAIMEGKEGDIQDKALQQIAWDIEPEQIGDSLRTVLKKTFLYKYQAAMQWEKAEVDLDFYDPYLGIYNKDKVMMYRLEYAVSQLRDPSFVKFFVNMGRYGICGNGPDEIFRQFPDTSVVLLTEAISMPTTSFIKMGNGLALLSELAVSHKMGRLRFSHESSALLIATGRLFLEGGFLPSLPMQDTTDTHPGSRSDVLLEAMILAVALDDPGLVDVLETLATNPGTVAALGIPDERIKYIQEMAQMFLDGRPYMGIVDC